MFIHLVISAQDATDSVRRILVTVNYDKAVNYQAVSYSSPQVSNTNSIVQIPFSVNIR
jgi:hypothetical protein